MTKKNWIEWQNRIGETKRIFTFFQPTAIFNDGDTIEHADFEDNTVILKVKRYKKKNFEYIPLHRNEIMTIEYKFNNKKL